MDFELNEEHRMIQKMTREFAEGRVKPIAAELDKAARYPAELVQEMARLGLMGVAVPEEYGGAGMDNLSYVIALEEVCTACASTGVIMSVNNSLVCDPLLKNGNELQKREFLAPLARGDRLGCFCLTEPEAGSDASNQHTRARMEDDHWIISGTKRFITNGVEADLALVFAQTDPAKAHRGISAFLVERGTEGFSVAKVEEKMGIKASSTAELVFEDCAIPRENMLGEEGRGFRIAMETLDGGRIGIAAQAVGLARAAMEESIRYAKERRAFGKPIAEHQAIQFMLADMATEIQAARWLAYVAAHKKDRGERHTQEAAMAKLFASEMAVRVTSKGVQIHGGYGYIRDFPLERYFRDAKITEIYEGTSEVQRMIIASQLLKD